jgi:glycosyltransferase involved in cell wall biosynthesis
LSPSAEFDVHFYRDTNPDVVRAGDSPLTHYLKHGRTERRYPNWRRLRQDAERVEASGLFDARVYAWDRGVPALPGLSDVEDYLALRNHGAPIGTMFDSAFYARAYDDVLDSRPEAYSMPILHYIGVGFAQHRVCTRQQLFQQMDAERSRFNDRYYIAQFRSRFPDAPLPADPLQHYILSGSRLGLDPAPDFSADYYLRLYPDMRLCGMDPFFHFAAHGHAEGRTGRPDFSSMISPGGAAFDTSKPTILVASHEASRTGAPLVGLNVGARLADTHNVISYLGKSGPLQEEFASHSCALAVAPLSPLDAEYLLVHLKAAYRLAAVLLNSVETSPFAQAALQADLPSVALVHEFAEYTLPPGRMSDVIESVDRIVTPARLICDSLQAEALATRSGHANNIEVQPQGYLPHLPEDEADADLTRDEILVQVGAEGRTDVKLVLGAGYVQMRKGVDLFVQIAGEVRRLFGDDFRFIWVGDGYFPKSDLHYSAWVADMVRRLDLDQHVFFLPPQSSLDALFALSDVFLLPSRLDPFPNVALDAFKAGRAVVCFDRATGVAETLRDAPGRKAAVGAAVEYCSVTQAAEALVQLFKPAEAKRALGNAGLAKRQFDFGGYMGVIAAQLARAAALRDEAMQATQAIIDSGLFDASFHENMAPPVEPSMLRAAVRTYVARGQKGLLRYNPRPGVNEGAARLRLAQPGPALDLHGAAPTHRCVKLTNKTGSKDTRPGASVDASGLRAALHLHLHYPELAAEFVTRLTAARMKLDVIVTTTSDARRLEIEYAFRGYKGGSTRYLVAPNRGRDIGPFLTEVGRLVGAGEYDVIGHLHGKRSLAVDAGLGDRWRSYLLDTLLGGDEMLSLFERDPRLGLVFAEDRHCVGWSKNWDTAAALAARMEPSPTLPQWPIFPIGTMFWARPAALAPLWALGLGAADFPAEPAPYDGTVLHALERMLPAICEAAGHGWCTVYREGSGW